MLVDDRRAADALARCEAAVPGPWYARGEYDPEGRCDGWDLVIIIDEEDPDDPGVAQWGSLVEDGLDEDDVEFMAHARTDLPDALADRAEAVALLRQVVEEAGDEYGFCEAIREFLGDADA